jgi:hypothetical protein
MRATTLVQQRQRCLHINNSNNTIVMRATIAIATMAKRPTHQQRQQCHRDDGKDACTLMMTKTPLQQGQQCQLEDSVDTIRTRETMSSRIKSNNVIFTRATAPA